MQHEMLRRSQTKPEVWFGDRTQNRALLSFCGPGSAPHHCVLRRVWDDYGAAARPMAQNVPRTPMPIMRGAVMAASISGAPLAVERLICL